MNWPAIGSVIGILVGLTALISFWSTRRRVAMDEGKKQQQVEQLRLDLDRAHDKIRDIEGKLSTTEGDMRELKADVKHILTAIGRLEAKIDSRGGA